MGIVICIKQTNIENIIIGIATSVLATIIILITRTLYYKFISTYPSNKIFNKIKNSKEKCQVFQIRLIDKEKKGEYFTPVPDFSSFSNNQISYEKRQLTPYVLSTEDSRAVAIILNVLGEIGRTENIEILYVDKDFDKWENPMFLIGGSWKLDRAYENFNSYFKVKNGQFLNKYTNESFSQKDINDDLGLLEKINNNCNNKPIWIAVGMRGAGTAAAAYTLQRWWKIFGKLYGKKPFGVIVAFSDKDGIENSYIISYYPIPKLINRILYLRTYNKLRKLKKKY